MSTNTAMSAASQEHFVSDKDVELFCEKQNVITFPAPPLSLNTTVTEILACSVSSS